VDLTAILILLCWDVTVCSLVDMSPSCGGGRFLCNASTYLPDYTTGFRLGCFGLLHCVVLYVDINVLVEAVAFIFKVEDVN
jgi:hypothetical protein